MSAFATIQVIIICPFCLKNASQSNGATNFAGKVFQIKGLTVDDIISSKGDCWSEKVALNFLGRTLNVIKSKLDASNELEYYWIDFDVHKKTLKLERLPHHRRSYEFLPETFIKQFKDC